MLEEPLEPLLPPIRRTFAGVGSRKTPKGICLLMKRIALLLAENQWLLRSGAAEGADQAFQSGVEEFCSFRFAPNNFQQIYLPWSGFNEYEEDFNRGLRVLEHSAEAVNIASYCHPKWEKLGSRGRRLITRNGFQILGEDLQSPVDMVICWTSDGSIGTTSWETGGTGQAIRIAAALDIPINNLRLDKHREHWENCVATHTLSLWPHTCYLDSNNKK